MASSVKVILRTHKTLKNGEHPIYLRIIMHRKTNFLSIGASCSKDMWDSVNNQPKKKHKLYRHICLLIDHKKTEAQKKIIEVESRSELTTSEMVKEALKPKAPLTANVIVFLDQHIAKLHTENRIGTAKIFKSLRNSLVTFHGNEKLMFSQINLEFLERFELSFVNRGAKLNSVFVFLRTLKTAINFAKKQGLVDNTYNPFQDYSFIKFRKIKTKKRKISKEDILKISAYNTEENTWLRHAQNIFMFSYYNFGINFIDVSLLKFENIKKGRLYYKRKKTGDDFDIKLNEPSLKIIEYYQKNPHPDADGYIFPILSAIHKSENSIDNRIRKILKVVNKSLQEIALHCEIDEHLTTYVARHSFANVLKQNNVATSVISEMMGHETERVTQIYLDSFGDETIDDAAKNLL